MREAKREKTRYGLGPLSGKAAGQETRSPEGCDEWAGGGVAPQSRINFRYAPSSRLADGPILIATPLYASRILCTGLAAGGQP